MVTQAEAAAYLLRHGLLEPSDVVDRRVAIRDASSRNRNFKVEVEGRTGYLVKQGLGVEGAMTVAHEAAVYQRLVDLGGRLRSYAPGYHGYDAQEGVLVLELVDGGVDLRTHHLREGAFPATVGEDVGAALAVFHSETRGAYDGMPAQPPWVLSVHRPDVSVFRDVSAASIELIKIVQAEPSMGEALDELRRGWRVDSLVHHDVKWDNLLVPAGTRGVRLVDWEAAGPGDSAWDLGSALSQYLSAWLFSIPVTGAEPPQHFPALASYPLDSMKAALRAGWSSYLRGSPDGLRDREELLHRTVAYAGARLVQTAFEASQLVQQLMSPVVLHLQLAANVLRRPEAAAAQLLELDPDGAR